MGANPETSGGTVRYFKLIAKAEKAEPNGKRAIVEVVKRDGAYVHGDWFASLTGFIVHGEVREFEFEGEKNKKFVIKIDDGSEVCQFEFMTSFAAYGLINAMLCTDFTLPVEISAWIGKDGYVGAGIKYVGSHDSIRWGIPSEEQPKAVEYPTPGGKMAKDYTNIEAFWVEKFGQVASKLVRSNLNLAAAAPVAQISQGSSRESHVETTVVDPSEMYDQLKNPMGLFQLPDGRLVGPSEEGHPMFDDLPF